MANFLSSISVDGAIEISSGKRIRWGSGDAQIEEGSTANYSLDFSTYDGSSMTKALTLEGDNSATFTGSITASISADGDSTYTGIVVSESGLLKYRTKAQIRSDIGAGTGSGNVSNTGTPVDNQLAIWTDATTIEGNSNLTFSGTVLTVTGNTSTEWNTAYTDRFKWNGQSTGLLAADGRTSLGGTTVGQSFFTLSNPSAVSFPRMNADNSVDALSASDFRTAIGAGTGSGDGTITTVASGAGLQGGATSGIATLSVDYAGTDNYILATPYGSETPVGADTIAFVDSDNNVHSATISDLPFSNNSGTVTSVAVTVGTGLDVSGSPITSSGTIDIDLDLTEITVGAGLDTTATGISLDLSELASATGAMGSSDRFVLSSSGGSNRKSTPNLIGLSLFNNDAGFTTNSGTVTSTGSSGRIAVWNSSTGLTSDSDLQWNSTTNKLIFESDYSISDNNSDFELNHDDSDINTTIKGFGGNGALKIQENSIFTSASGFYVPSGYGISAGTTATASGTIRATGNIVAYYSDERLKDFKGNIPDALDKVCQLNGYYYTQNDKAAELGYENYERQVGVSAQEVEKVMPEVVETAPISYDNDDDYLTVDYGRLVPLLIESIKELKNEIEILKSKSCGN